MNDPIPIALLVSDLHLQLETPPARSPEKDWKTKMAEALHRLDKLARTLKVPIVCAGDVFDRWKAPPELINFALECMPTMYSIPGQHDLPFHSYQDMHRSAYGTLVAAGKLIDLPPGIPFPVATPAGAPDLVLYGYPWGFDVEPAKLEGGAINLAVVHAYIWTKGAGHPEAAMGARLDHWKAQLTRFHAAVFGDNHIPFQGSAGHCTVFNHGAFLLRKSDERRLKPMFGVLLSDGSVECHFNEGKNDKWLPEKEAKAVERTEELNLEGLLKELQEIGVTGLDYLETVRAYLEHHRAEVPARVRSTIIQLIDIAAT